MSLAAKVWARGEKHPPEGQRTHELPNCPPNWFHEEPEYAAELYASEIFGLRALGGEPTETEVYVLDEAGTLHSFLVKVVMTYETTVRRKP